MIDIGLGHYLTLGAIIFTIGIIGIFLNRKNIIVILICIIIQISLNYSKIQHLSILPYRNYIES